MHVLVASSCKQATVGRVEYERASGWAERAKEGGSESRRQKYYDGQRGGGGGGEEEGE